MANVYGHLVYLGQHTFNVWPTNIPDLFPITASIDTIIESAKAQGKQGGFEQDLENYEMVEAELEILN